MKKVYLIWMLAIVLGLTIVTSINGIPFIHVGNSTEDGELQVGLSGSLLNVCLSDGTNCPSSVGDTIWNIVGSIYLGNFSNVLDINSTILNATITNLIPNVTANGWVDDGDVVRLENSSNKVGIGTDDPQEDVHVIGDIELEHNATEVSDHAFDIIYRALGFGGTHALDIIYITGALAEGSDDEAILIDIDESEATGGEVAGVTIVGTEGSATLYGIKIGALVNPILQLSGVFSNMDSANNSNVGSLTAFTSSSTDVAIFVNDNDFVIIGDADKFEEIEWLLDTVASGAGIKPTFEFSTGINTWTAFSPTDATNGLRNNGVILWEDTDIPTWALGAGSEYLIRIIRTRNSLSTVPIEDKVQIAAVTEYKWDKDGDVSIRNLNATIDLCIEGGVCLSTVDTNITDTRWGFNQTTLNNQTNGNLTIDLDFLKSIFPTLATIFDFDTNITDTISNETALIPFINDSIVITAKKGFPLITNLTEVWLGGNILFLDPSTSNTTDFEIRMASPPVDAFAPTLRILGAKATENMIGDLEGGDIEIFAGNGSGGTQGRVYIEGGLDSSGVGGDIILGLKGSFVGIGDPNPSHLLTILTSGSTPAIRLLSDGSFGSGARLLFGDAGFCFIEEKSDDIMNIFCNVHLELGKEVEVTGISGDGIGKVVCVKLDGDLGTCSSVTNSTGHCTCG